MGGYDMSHGVPSVNSARGAQIQKPVSARREGNSERPKILNREEAIEYSNSIEKGSEIYEEIHRHLILGGVGIKDLSNGIKVDITEMYLLGGFAGLETVGAILISFMVKKGIPALKAGAKAAWKSLTGEEAADTEDGLKAQIDVLSKKVSKIEGGKKSEVEAEFKKIEKFKICSLILTDFLFLQ